MNSLPNSELEKFAAALVEGARRELYLTPKPGLVDLADSGSHADLSLPVMERSIVLLSDYLAELVRSLADGAPFAEQQRIGMAAERRQFDTLATNTHKGFIFLSGMLLIAFCHAGSADERALRAALSELAADFFRNGEQTSSNGQKARRKYGAGGIVVETARGFPSIFAEALPAFRASRRRSACVQTASFAMLARLMQTVDDTTTLHRLGEAGLAQIRRDGSELEARIARGGDYIGYLEALNRSYIRMNITMGGVADMLAVAFGYLVANGEIAPQGDLLDARATAAGAAHNPVRAEDTAEY